MPAAWIALVVSLWLLVILLGIVVLGLIRRVDQLEATPVGRRAGDVGRGHGPALRRRPPIVDGYEVLGVERRSRVVLFLSSTCGACDKLSAELLELGADPVEAGALDQLGFVVVADDEMKETFSESPWSVVSQTDGKLSRAWNIPGTPYAVAIDAEGLVQGSGFVATLAQVNDVASSLGSGSAMTVQLVGTS